MVLRARGRGEGENGADLASLEKGDRLYLFKAALAWRNNGGKSSKPHTLTLTASVPIPYVTWLINPSRQFAYLIKYLTGTSRPQNSGVRA